MLSLTEYSHAMNAAFGEQLSDPVQNAWLDATPYWTAWLGRTYGTIEAVIDYDGSTGPVFDTRGKCELAGYYCPPTWQLIQSCDAATALWVDGLRVEDELDTADVASEWPLLHMRRWADLGRMWCDGSVFVVDRKKYKVKCE